MSFPRQSSGADSSPGSLWWGAKYADDSGALQDHVCATQGSTFMEQLQTTLKAVAPIGLPPGVTLQSLAGHGDPLHSTVDPSTLEIDKAFGVRTLTALYNLLVQLSAPQALLDACLVDWQHGSADPSGATSAALTDVNQGTPIQWGTMAGALWVTYNRDLSFTAMSVPGDIVTVRWGLEPPDDGTAHGVAVCWKSGDPTPIEAGGTDATTPTTAPQGSLAMGTGSTTSTFFRSVSQVFQGQSTGSATLDVVIPVGLVVAGGAAIALIIAATNKRRAPARRRLSHGRRRRR